MNNNMNSSVTQTYNSFSGVDMLVTFGSTVVGEVQGVSYTVTREKAPLYTMGSADPRSFSRGKRGIAGSLIFLVFDRSGLLDAMSEEMYLANKWEVTKGQTTEDVVQPLNGAIAGSTATGTESDPRFQVGSGATDKVFATARYHDQIPPFDLVITAANEYGHTCRMSVQGVEIMNVGSGMSVDDITTDESCTFVARSVTPWNGATTLKQ